MLVHISSRHSKIKFCSSTFCYLARPLFENGANKNQHQDLYQRETVPDKFCIFFKISKAKKVVNEGEQNRRVCYHSSEICAEGIFVTFPGD